MYLNSSNLFEFTWVGLKLYKNMFYKKYHHSIILLFCIILLFIPFSCIHSVDPYALEFTAEAAQQSKGIFSGLVNGLKDLFFGIVQLITYLIAMAVGLIEWSLSPTFMDLIRHNPGLYMGWKTVRDILNMFFIFFLLYSAFCTIFQISRYHIRNTWVMIVVMALLVNFSWPIARVLIDFSNVTMDWMMNSTGMQSGNIRSGSALMSTIGDRSEFANILVANKNPSQTPNSWTNIFLGIIIGILFLIVVMAVALLLVIRVVALAILLVFASAGFTMAAFPMTSSYANKWWNQFIKYLVTGPILLFVLILSVSILQGLSSGFVSGAKNAAMNNGVIENVLIYVVSLIILWTGIMTVGAMGDGASSMVLNAAGRARGKLQGMGKGLGFGAVKFTDRKIGEGVNKLANIQGDGAVRRFLRDSGKELSVIRSAPQRWKNYRDNAQEKYDETISEVRARGVSTAPGLMGGDKDALERDKGKKIEEAKKKMRESPLNTATDIKSEARAQVLSEKKVDLLDNEVDELIKTFDKLDTETQKTVKKKMRDSGYGHKVLEMDIAHEEARRHKVAASGGSAFVPLSRAEIEDMAGSVFGGMKAEILAKQRASMVYRDTKAAVGSDVYNRHQAAYIAMSNRHSQLTPRGQQIFLDAQSRDQRQAFAEAEMRYTAPNPMTAAS